MIVDVCVVEPSYAWLLRPFVRLHCADETYWRLSLNTGSDCYHFHSQLKEAYPFPFLRSDKKRKPLKQWFFWGLPNFPITSHIRLDVKKPEVDFIQILIDKKYESLSKNPKDYDHDMVRNA